jgi:hypothetical protein
MKHILFFFAVILAHAATAQSWIETAGDMKVDAGIRQFSSPNIYVNGCYNVAQQTWTVDLQFVDTSTFENSGFTYTLKFTKAEVDAFTGAGTSDTDKLQNALEQTVIDYLEVINGSIFTIRP